MRDVVTGFYCRVLGKLIAAGRVSTSDKVLVVCGGPLDEAVMRMVGFTDFTITNVDDATSSHHQDAESLTYPDRSFDVVIVHAGLHHCYSPHKALLEMYRVARKCVVAFEARDSLMMRLAVRFGLTMDYEVNSIGSSGKGGVANTGIPNFIYRWTERDVIGTISSYDPAHVHDVEFFHDMRLPIQRFTRSGRRVLQLVGMMIEPLSALIAAIAPKQCNEFAFAIFKTGKLKPWLQGHQ